MPTSTTVKGLNINELTEAQYDAAVQGGVIGPNELSVLTDVSYVEPSDLATVATTGDYDDLINKPTIPAGLPDQTGHSGEFLTTDGTDASWAAVNALQNTATGTGGLGILGTSSGNYSIVMGSGATDGGANGGVAIGKNAQAKSTYTVAIGENARANYNAAVGIGGYAQVGAEGAIQIGCATNNETGTVKFAVKASGGFTNYKIMDSDGTIPEARLADTTNAAQGQVLALDSNLDAVWTTPSGGGLPSQTGNAGKFLTTDGTDASWATVNALQNTATQSSSLTILGTATTGYYNVNIGTDTQCGTQACVAVGYFAQTSTTASNAVAVGYYASAWENYTTAVGNNTKANKIGATAIGNRVGAENTSANGTYTVGIGYNSQTQANYGIAIGAPAKVTAANAIQIGNSGDVYGYTNSDANTFKVGNANGNFEMMSADGTIPTARLTKVNSTITLTAAGWSSNTQTVTVTGMTATGVVLVSPDPTDQSAYTSAGILCTAQAADSLTFTCSTTPSADIDVNVVML